MLLYAVFFNLCTVIITCLNKLIAVELYKYMLEANNKQNIVKSIMH